MMKNHKENEGITAIKKRGKESPQHLSLKQKCLKLIEKSYKVDIEAHYKRFFIDAIVFKNGITIPVECGTVSKNKLMSLINDFNQVVWIPYNSEPVVLTRENFHQYIDKIGYSSASSLVEPRKFLIKRKIIKIGDSRAITLPKEWMKMVEEQIGGQLEAVAMTVDSKLALYPMKDGQIFKFREEEKGNVRREEI
jgi:antitoxin component of MazEF toxin-antitoxin module